MAYETITVRMNRSSASIPWGISVRGAGAGALSIASVEKESLADKAGIEVNDTITELIGRKTASMSLQEARNIIERPSDEIHMLLQRYITSHPTLPWKLTEQDNKIVVDHVRPQDTSKYKTLQGTETRNQFSAHSTSSYEVPPPSLYDSGSYHSSSYSKFSEDNKQERAVPIAYQTAPFTNVTNSKSYDSKSHMRDGFQNSYMAADSYAKTESHQRDATGDGYLSHEQQQQQQPSSQVSSGTRNVPIALSYTSSANAPSAPQHPSHQSAFNTTITPVHVNTNYGTSFAPKSSVSPYRRSAQTRARSEASYHDEGPHVAFQHSPRTRRQLSPSASIRHLQYNSPMNLYSSESAAEEYRRQTGGLFGTESGTRVDSVHHVPAPKHSPQIVKPVADRATPNSGGPVFSTEGRHTASSDVVTTLKPQNVAQDEPIPMGPPSAPAHQGAIQQPPSGVVPPPPPPPPSSGTTFSAKVNPIKPPSTTVNKSSGIASQRSPISAPIRRTPLENEAHAASRQSPRARRELSPQAMIRHLQYNSPMNIYSIESAAEQYLKQTGGLFGTETDPNRLKSHDPSYLHSETRRLIEEEERGVNHGATTPAQSSSFKRISAACGTPVQ